MPASTPPATREDPRHLLDALPAKFPRPRITIFYALALLLVAAAMLLLPVLYLLIVAGTATVLFLHASSGFSPLHSVAGAYGSLLLYFGPLFAGVVVLLLLLKPLFASRPQWAPSRAIRREEEPHLYALAEKLARLVGTPAPTAIHASARVNAGAGLHMGLARRLHGRIFVEIGLPLVAGLTFRQFVGVLAHELGHLGQGGATRLGRFIDGVNDWFARAVYERDTWDEQLIEWLEDQSGSALAQLPALLARAAVWTTRRVLWVLMIVGHGLSCLLSRERERDADRYEARLVGGSTKAATLQQLELLAIASFVIESEIETGELGRLPDDLPALVAARAGSLSPALARRVRNAALGRETGFFDTHPSVRDRIARAHREGRGCLQIDAPASAIFRDFAGICRRVTRELYGPVTAQDLVATSAVLKRQRKARAASHGAPDEARIRFFQGIGAGGWRFFPEARTADAASGSPARPGALREALEALRAQLTPELRTAREAEVRWCRVAEARSLARQAASLLAAGVPINARYFRLQSANAEGVVAALQRTSGALQESRAYLRPYEGIQRRRLALALLESPSGRPRRAAESFLAVLEALGRIDDELVDLRDDLACFDVLAAAQAELPGDERVRQHLELLRSRLCARVDEMATKVGDVVYHFPNGSGSMPLAGHLVPDAPRQGEGSGVARDILTRAFALHARLLGELAALAEASESAAGLPLLAAPNADAVS